MSETTTSPTTPLPTIALLNDVMTVQGFLRAVSQAALPAVITGDPQYATLVSDYDNWRYNLWAEFWEGLLSGNITPQSRTIQTLFDDGITDIGTMHGILYDGATILTVSACNAVADLVNDGQPLLASLETIAEGIEDADKAAVARLTTLADKLSTQFNKQEDELTQKAIDTGADVVVTAIDVAVAVGTEGEDIAPLIKSVIKVGEDVIQELVLTQEIKKTLGELETAWADLDQASADLAQITLTCRRLKAVTDDASATLTALQDLSDRWSTVAAVTNDDAGQWQNGGRDALQTWAGEMNQLTFGYATQTINAAQAAAA